jgi:hypothetical protein
LNARSRPGWSWRSSARQLGNAAIHPGRTVVLVVVLAAALACAGTASAGFTAFPDRNDKPGPLDIRQTKEGTARRPARPQHHDVRPLAERAGRADNAELLPPRVQHRRRRDKPGYKAPNRGRTLHDIAKPALHHSYERGV